MPAAVKDPSGLKRVYCLNPACPEWTRTRRRQVIGEAAPASVVRLKCPKCRQYQTMRIGA